MKRWSINSFIVRKILIRIKILNYIVFKNVFYNENLNHYSTQPPFFSTTNSHDCFTFVALLTVCSFHWNGFHNFFPERRQFSFIHHWIEFVLYNIVSRSFNQDTYHELDEFRMEFLRRATNKNEKFNKKIYEKAEKAANNAVNSLYFH